MYKLTGQEDVVQRLPDMAFVSRGGAGWDEYEEWLNEGNAPLPQYTAEELLAHQLTIATNDLTAKSRQATAQITAIQGRVTALDFTVNGQDPDDPDYLPPLDSEIAELPVRVAQLKAWNLYSTRLGRVKLQATWPSAPVWPVMPEPLTNEVSAVSAPLI